MNDSAPSPPDMHLPARLPDLVVSGRDETWAVSRLAPRLAALAGVAPAAGGGRLLRQLLPQSVPDLNELAREAPRATSR